MPAGDKAKVFRLFRWKVDDDASDDAFGLSSGFRSIGIPIAFGVWCFFIRLRRCRRVARFVAGTGVFLWADGGGSGKQEAGSREQGAGSRMRGCEDARMRRKCLFDGQGVQVVAGKGKRRAVHGVVHRKRG